MDGFTREIWENGDHSIGQCINGLANGISYYYNSKGDLYKREEFSNGKFIKRWWFLSFMISKYLKEKVIKI